MIKHTVYEMNYTILSIITARVNDWVDNLDELKANVVKRDSYNSLPARQTFH